MSQYKSLSNVIAASLLLVSFAEPTSSDVSASSTADHDPASIANRQSPISTLLFVPNHGQWPEEVRFQLRGLGGTWWFTDEAVWLTVIRGTEGTQGTENSELRPRSPCHLVTLSPCHLQGVALRLTFPGLSPTARLVPSNKQSAKMNYFLGSDPARWAANVPTYGALRWEGVEPGVDMEIDGQRWRVVDRDLSGFRHPFRWGAAPKPDRSIRLQVEGADGLHVTDTGRLVAETAIGSVPLPFQAAALDGNTVFLSSPSSYSSLSSSVPQFPSSPHSSDLHPSSFILAPRVPVGAQPSDDPTDLLFSTFLGDNSPEPDGITLGVDGSVYVTGRTGGDFPTTPGAFDPSENGAYDLYVSRLSADGSSLMFSTYLGGNYNEYSADMAVSPDGTVYVTGSSASRNFPTTPGAFDRVCTSCGIDEFGDITDVIVSKLSADGSTLVYSTYLGGMSGHSDFASDIALGQNGTAYVTGYSLGNFPVTPGAFDTTHDGGWNAFVTRLNPTGTGLIYSSYLGGGGDIGYGIAVGPDGSATVTGYTESANFPVTPQAFDATFNGQYDVFVSRLSADGSSLVASTYVGGAGYDIATDVAVGPDGTAYITGRTDSSDFPVTPGAFDTTNDGDSYDAFVSKVSPDASSLVYSTFLGGTGFECVNQDCSIALGAGGSAYIGGSTASADFPTTPGAYDTSYNGGTCGLSPYTYPCYDAFVSRLTPDGSGLLYSTFLGGSRDECRYAWECGIAVGADGSAYLASQTYSPEFPVTPGAYDTTFDGFGASAISRLVAGDRLPPLHISSIIPRYQPAGQGYRIGVEVEVVDGANVPIAGATVNLLIILPDGRQVQVTGQTGAQGHFSPVGRTQSSGTYTFIVTGVSKAGYAYDPSQNVETSDSVTIP